MFSSYFGETIAILTALVWAISCQANSMTARAVGVGPLTLLRLPVSTVLLGSLCLITGARITFAPDAMLLLAISGVMGVSLCDPLFYIAAIRIGPRLALLVQSLSACITALLGALFLNEFIGPRGWLGILVATAGVTFAVTDGRNIFSVPGRGVISKKELWIGVLLSFLSAVALALGFIFTKQALRVAEINTIWATLTRLFIGGALLWIFGLPRGWVGELITHITRKKDLPWRIAMIGLVIGAIGTWFSVVAVKHTETGVAATLIGLEPIMIIPIATAVEKRMPGLRGILGAGLAFIGTALLLLR